MRFSKKMTRSPVSFYPDEKSLNYYRYYEKLTESLNKLDVRMKALNVELDAVLPPGSTFVPSATSASEMSNGRKRLYVEDDDRICVRKKTTIESVEISGCVLKPWEDKTITDEMLRSPGKYDLHWCKYGSLKQHHWSRRENHYFKKNGDSSSTCLYHKRIAHSPKNVASQNSKTSEEHKRIMAAAEAIEDEDEKEAMKMTSTIYRDCKKAQERAAHLKLIGKCPGMKDSGCKEGNDAVVNRIYCAICQDLVDTHNSNNYEALRKCYAKSKNLPQPSTTIYEFLSSRRQSVVAALACVKHILLSKRVVIWDTESNGRGGTHDIEKTREWFLFKLETNEVLHIRRDNPGYSNSSAARQFLDFIEDVDHLVAYEKSSCDRNRAKELLGDETYKPIASKFVDFYRLTSPVIDNDPHSTIKAYVQTRKLPTVYEYFFPANFTCLLPLLEIPDKIDKKDKCKWDVYRLCNLFLVFRSLVSIE